MFELGPEMNLPKIEEMKQPLENGLENGNVADLTDMNANLEGADENIESRVLEPEICYDLPNCDVALVTGDALAVAEDMDFNQGDNPFSALGNCGLVSICNALRRAGVEITEDDVTKLAIDSGLCNYNPFGDPGENGGTSIFSRQEVLAELGIDSEVYLTELGCDINTIADAIDSGRGVVISVSADLLWDTDLGGIGYDGPVSNHCVAVTGIARDVQTGEICGVFVADSGRGLESDACRYLTLDKFDEVFTNVRGTGANITTDPIMEV